VQRGEAVLKRSDSAAVTLRGRLILKPTLASSPLDEILPEDDPRNAGNPGEWNHSRAVEYETPAQTANSLTFKA